MISWRHRQLRAVAPLRSRYSIGNGVGLELSARALRLSGAEMRKILIGAIGAVALSVSAPASAADLAARPYTKAPSPAVAAIYNWGGFYIGLNGGGASSHKCWDLNGLAEGPGRPITPVSPAIS